jgi:hypothetical protein
MHYLLGETATVELLHMAAGSQLLSCQGSGAVKTLTMRGERVSEGTSRCRILDASGPRPRASIRCVLGLISLILHTVDSIHPQPASFNLAATYILLVIGWCLGGW